jgi:hypothetical protein
MPLAKLSAIPEIAPVQLPHRRARLTRWLNTAIVVATATLAILAVGATAVLLNDG